ncbi:MAG TPA: hypothetical protein VMG10_18705 [Gemmataceae bacterium]|nr:hypothetical protein [Gemmataceae bacterium]
MPSLFLPSATKGRRIVLWTLVCLAISQLVLSIYLDKRRLEMRDPLYSYRLNRLRERLAELPNPPLFLILGSSRVKYSIWPSAMKLHATEKTPQPIVYNFGMNGMGTIRELMYFRRLLADGVRPNWILLEVWPPLWAEDGFFRESRMIQGEDDLHWRDLPLICRYFRRDLDVLRLALRRSLLPISDYRTRLLDAVLPPLLPRDQTEVIRRKIQQSSPDDGGGWFPLPWEFKTPEAKRYAHKDGEEKIKPLLQPVRIDPRSDAALRELLTECQLRGTKVTLILMPEHSACRGWYTPEARTIVRDYLSRLHRDYPVPIVDTRTWVADDDFSDTCHMGQSGVPAFCERLGRDVVQPLLEDRPLESNVLFAE